MIEFSNYQLLEIKRDSLAFLDCIHNYKKDCIESKLHLCPLEHFDSIPKGEIVARQNIITKINEELSL